MFEKKLRLEEGITMDADRLLAIALREFKATQEEFRTLAGRLDGGDPDRRVAEGQGGSSGAGPAGDGRAGSARGADDLHRSPRAS